MGAGCSSHKSSAAVSDVNQSSHPKMRTLPALKIVIVGDSEVGKTSIFLRYIHNQFSPVYIPTKKAVIENVVKKLNLPNHAMTSLSIWDIPGREDMNLYKSYFRNLDAAIVVVDLTDPDTIQMAPVWQQIVLNNAYMTRKNKETGEEDDVEEETLVSYETFPVLLLGTKLDVIEERLTAEGKRLFSDGKRNTDRLNLVREREDELLITEDASECKPDCIKQLEKIAEERNFIGSVVVSARDGDGSVHTAIQRFLRHILEKRFMTRRWRSKETLEIPKREKALKLKSLEKTGIPEIDAAFCEDDLLKLIRRIEVLRDFSNKSLDKFKSICIQKEIVSENEGNSLEDCIVGLRKHLRDSELKLQLVEEDGFCSLEVKYDDDDDKAKRMNKTLKTILKTFNKEYATSCQVILEEFPPTEKRLEKIDKQVSKAVEEYLLPVEPGQKVEEDLKNLKTSSDKIEKNRALIQHAMQQTQMCLSNVKNNLKKSRTAFIW